MSEQRTIELGAAEPYARVVCVNCGPKPLTEEQYTDQISNPWKTWRCPNCNDDADFDDTYFEKRHGIE